MSATPSAARYAPATPFAGEGVAVQTTTPIGLFSPATSATPESRTYRGDREGSDEMREASARTRPPSWEIGCCGRSGVAVASLAQPSGAPGWLAWTARTALPTHDPASVPSAASPEPPGGLRAPPAAPPWLAPSTSIRAPGESGQGTVRARLRLPSVAECAELLAGGWTPALGRLGVWADDSGDGWGRWWTWALEIARRDRSRARADGGRGACHGAPGRAILAAMAEGATE